MRMRRFAAWALLVLVPATTYADDTVDGIIHVHRLGEAQLEPLLHLDAAGPIAAEAEGGLLDGRTAVLALGPRARLSAEGEWWRTGLAPSMFAEDLQVHGWRAGAELSYDLGLLRLGVNAAMDRDGYSSHRMVGLFAYRTLRLSRWMHAWIVLGAALEEWDGAPPYRRQGTTIGLSVGTTFR